MSLRCTGEATVQQQRVDAALLPLDVEQPQRFLKLRIRRRCRGVRSENELALGLQCPLDILAFQLLDLAVLAEALRRRHVLVLSPRRPSYAAVSLLGRREFPILGDQEEHGERPNAEQDVPS
jgi:hypothetical protein